MPFKQLGVKGAWKRIQDVDGDIYWVHTPLTTQKYKCAVIKNNKTKNFQTQIPNSTLALP